MLFRNKLNTSYYAGVFAIGLGLFSSASMAQTDPKDSDDSSTVSSSESATELAKALQNPLGNLMSFPFQDNLTLGGKDAITTNVMNFQPVIPLLKGRIITRTIVPVISQEANPTNNNERIHGVGNIVFTSFVATKPKNGITLGAGPVVNFPTARYEAFGPKDWGMGGSLGAVKMGKKFVYGALVNNIWGVGDGQGEINNMLFQYFINYNMKNGLAIAMAPTLTANWLADKGERWTVPFGGGVSKIVKVGGKLPLNFSLTGYYNAIKPSDYVGNWTIRSQVTMLLPGDILSKFKHSSK
jgi:hypothetical protein